MRTLKSNETRQTVGVTVGARKDGSVAVLFDDNTIRWYKADEFASKFKVV